MDKAGIDHLNALAEEKKLTKIDSLLASGITNPRSIAGIMFDLGRACGLSDAIKMMETP